MSNEELIKQLDSIKERINQAQTWLRGDMKDPALFQVITSHREIERMVRAYDPDRYGPKKTSGAYYPEMIVSPLRVCDICGQPHCQSDHK